MKVQINTDNKITLSEERIASFIDLLKKGLSRFSNQLTRVEAHLSDENGNKEGLGDKRCLLEARLEGLPPIAVSNNANSSEQSVIGAMEKLKTTLDKTLGRLRDH